MCWNFGMKFGEPEPQVTGDVDADDAAGDQRIVRHAAGPICALPSSPNGSCWPSEMPARPRDAETR